MGEAFSIVPAPTRALVFCGIFFALMVALAGLFGYLAWSSRNVRFQVSSEGLQIRGDLYGRTIPLASLGPDEARRVDPHHERELLPRWRTNGVGMPGYASGWFKLRNGEKALVFLTERHHMVRVPTREGWSLVVSPENPDAFVASVNRLISAGGRVDG